MSLAEEHDPNRRTLNDVADTRARLTRELASLRRRTRQIAARARSTLRVTVLVGVGALVLFALLGAARRR